MPNEQEESDSYTFAVSNDTLIGIAFVFLKLIHVINWPWIWVLAPFWVPLLMNILVAFIVFIVNCFLALITNKNK